MVQVCFVQTQLLRWWAKQGQQGQHMLNLFGNSVLTHCVSVLCFPLFCVCDVLVMRVLAVILVGGPVPSFVVSLL